MLLLFCFQPSKDLFVLLFLICPENCLRSAMRSQEYDLNSRLVNQSQLQNRPT